MKTFASLDAAQAAAHPGQFIMALVQAPNAWAVMSVGERQMMVPSGKWTTVERKKPYHNVLAEAGTDWHDDDTQP